MALYLTAVAGTTITAAWGNNARDGLITHFANVAARTSAVTTPAESMVSFLQDAPKRFEFYDGSLWRPIGAVVECTSSIRPPSPRSGLRIRETDTGFSYEYNGSKWLRDLVKLRSTGTTSYTSNTTKAAVPGMSVAVETNSIYEIDGWIEVFGAQNVGLQMDLSVPASSVPRGTSLGFRDVDGAFVGYQWSLANPADLGSFGYAITTNQSGVYLKGTVFTFGTAGNITLRASQRASNTATSSILDSSWMNVTQLA